MDDKELIARLRHKTQHRSSDDTAAAYAKTWERLDNPDGPEAAARIEALLKERDEVNELLEKIELSLAKISGFFFDTFPRKEIRAFLKRDDYD